MLDKASQFSRRVSTAARALVLTPPPKQAFVCECSPFVYRMAWLFIFSVHAMHAAGLVRAGYSQVRTISDPSETSASLRVIGDAFRVEYYYLAVMLGAVFSLYQMYSISSMVLYSFRAGALALIDPFSTGESTNALRASVRSLTASFTHRFSRLSRLIDLYGIRGPYFEHTFHAKELYEILWGTILVYQNLYHIAHPLIGYLSLVVLVVNCWTTPLIYTLYSHPNHRATRVVLCLLVDVVLDFVSALVLPFLVYFEYRALLSAPQRNDAVWTFLLGTDVQHFSTNSVSSILSRVLPSTSMVMNLSSIKPVLKRRGRRGTLMRQIGPALPPTEVAVVTNTPAPSRSPIASVLPTPTTQTTPTTPTVSTPTIRVQSTRSRALLCLHAGLIAYGLAVVLLVVLGERRGRHTAMPGCRVVMSHWIVTKVPCAILDMDCGFLGLESHAAVVDLLLQSHRVSLHTLTFSNCPSLVVPDEITLFRNLIWIEIRNSTVEDWSLSAAPTSHTSPILSRIIVVDTNFSSSIPPALLSPTLPSTLKDFTFANSNLTNLPADLHTRWPQSLASLTFERCGWTSVPTTVVSMQTGRLSLAGNLIEVIPALLLEGKSFSLLSLASNPINELPELASAPTVQHLVSTMPQGMWLVGTNISSLPTWMYASQDRLIGNVYADATPLCLAHREIQGLTCRTPAALVAASSFNANGFIVATTIKRRSPPTP